MMSGVGVSILARGIVFVGESMDNTAGFSGIYQVPSIVAYLGVDNVTILTKCYEKQKNVLKLSIKGEIFSALNLALNSFFLLFLQ